MTLFLVAEFIILSLIVYALIEFIREKEWYAVFKIISLFLLTVLLAIFLIHIKSNVAFITFCSLIGLTSFILLIPLKSKRGSLSINKNLKYDERNTMFSRNELVEDSEKYVAYYKTNPDKLIADTKFRREPGLLSPQGKYYNAFAFEAAESYFKTIKQLHPLVHGVVNTKKTRTKADNLSSFIKTWSKQLGALDVRITELKPHHIYSYKGRGNEYGNEILNNHKYAIAFTVEMNQQMVNAAPKASIVMESAKQYLNAGTIAILIAQHIRQQGFDARAHIDGNYQVICPLVAKDAGLGEIGRMGLLMTPKHGPRVRIGVVTTDIELISDITSIDNSVEQFCKRCKKCAECCPSQSIPTDNPKENNGSVRWQIDSESCFTFWCKVGTDCGRCMAVCPYSHPDTLFHRFIRWGIRNNRLFLILAVSLDDFFYGKKPKSKKLPSWLAK